MVIIFLCKKTTSNTEESCVRSPSLSPNYDEGLVVGGMETVVKSKKKKKLSVLVKKVGRKRLTVRRINIERRSIQKHNINAR